ncbi:ABC transporter permease [Spelaeicoccus albus]|uniref:Spermidine/putrescine transport system permease protein n=1 Tax=Spelaeicoccus albus TaxID=1280376 RepID=A0A7Z0A9Y4_9MICO|nr:ABC transporter permease [Spelaeicoccus albus]NYI66301.1 spermidine/putrescine transport system permease protein [Spelaeicoccus albus]
MTLSTTRPGQVDPAPEATEPQRRPRKRGRLLHAYTWLVIFWLCLPILVMIAFGFNATTGRYNFVWQGFTFRWYRELFAIPNLTNALINSLTIAVIVTVIATVLGTFVGLALGRYKFRGRSGIDLLLFANIAAPEIAIGAALLSLFVSLGIPRGYWTIVVAHVMFDIAYVAITVRARTAGYDQSLEEAAADLGAGPWTTFRLITLRVIMPGVMAGAMLSFALSIDDFIITQFTAGQTLTFPLWVWGASRVGTPPQVNVMGTLIFVFGVLLVLGNIAIMRRRDKSSRTPAE